MKNKLQETTSKAASSLWSLLIGTLYFTIISVVLCFGYLLFEDNIQAHFNKKKYSDKELELISKRAIIKQSLEDEEANWDKVTNGVHVRTGMKYDPNLQIVIATCTSCHSAKLITQNKATREGWKSMIKWMQATQGLPDLGKTEPVILDYLSKYYAPSDTGRRKNIDISAIEWFILNIENNTQ